MISFYFSFFFKKVSTYVILLFFFFVVAFGLLLSNHFVQTTISGKGLHHYHKNFLQTDAFSKQEIADFAIYLFPFNSFSVIIKIDRKAVDTTPFFIQKSKGYV